MPQCPNRHPDARRSRGFTLTELLIVIGIMVLVMAMAVPAFNFISGSRSIDNATNLVSSNLSRARMAAIRHQQPHGLVFYRDAATNRVALGMARFDPTTQTVDIMAGADLQFLPPGVSIAFRHDTDDAGSYTYRMGDSNLYGAVLFSSQGHVMHSPYGVRDDSELGRRLDLDDNFGTYNGENLYSQPAFLLFTASGLENALDPTTWLNENATFLLVNRYNGALTLSE